MRPYDVQGLKNASAKSANSSEGRTFGFLIPAQSVLLFERFPRIARRNNKRSILRTESERFYSNLLKPTGHVMHQQFNIQQLYVLPTLYLCVLYLSENKQRLVPLTS